MKLFFNTCIAVLFCTITFAQDKYFTITGQVVDEKTKQPMAGASVFCQNTTVGTTSNNEGKFFLRLNNGGYDLVVSYTGFETKMMRISNGNPDNDKLVIELKEQDKNLNEVVVAGSAEVADGWSKYGNFFIANFIGTTPNASDCNIENKDAIHFYFYKKRNKLKVRAKDDIIITNNALGYKIKYQLDSFVYDYNTKVSSYTGYPLFEELNGSEAQKAAWKQNRFNTYIGSRLHFMRCLYDSAVKEEGYEIELLDSTDNNKSTPIVNPYDSQYYSVDSGDVQINFHGRIRVKYKNQPPDQKYLIINKFPLSSRIQISALDILDGFVIEENGYFYEQSEVTNMGYWAWKKLAELLPYDYNPE
ncbi:MAG: carboxypeptidase-like regulatory domain-containing protein [Bacteroidetes bacterium]|nr:carboxypeptidase-like regulatory domain-containing protein [Bacteroidota bacterium]